MKTKMLRHTCVGTRERPQLWQGLRQAGKPAVGKGVENRIAASEFIIIGFYCHRHVRACDWWLSQKCRDSCSGIVSHGCADNIARAAFRAAHHAVKLYLRAAFPNTIASLVARALCQNPVIPIHTKLFLTRIRKLKHHSLNKEIYNEEKPWILLHVLWTFFCIIVI